MNTETTMTDDEILAMQTKADAALAKFMANYMAGINAAADRAIANGEVVS